MYRKSLIYILIVAFTATSIILPQKSYAAPLLGLPEPGKMVSLSTPFAPAMIKGLTVSKTNPFQFDFIVDVGQDRLQGEALKAEGDKLIKYFLASLAIPEKDWWVNLSPYEKDKTAPEALSQTDMGRDLLAQDYILKQITASLIYPEKELGKTFWDRVYAKSQELYGNTQIPVNTFNKVWITADQAEVFEHHQTAFVTKAHLKVMLEEDYLASQKHNVETRFIASQTTNKTTQNIIREIIIPELEKEVNEGKNFANLRQIFNALILASWYKNNLKTALLTQVYADKSTVKGIDLDDKTIKEQIYNRYLQAYKKGVFNFVKEDTQNNQITPRKYFSGGVNPGMAANPDMTSDVRQFNEAMSASKDRLVNINAAMNSNNLKQMEERIAELTKALDSFLDENTLSQVSQERKERIIKERSDLIQQLEAFKRTKNDAAMISKQLTDENKSVSFELADKRSEFKLLLGKLTSRIEFEWGHYRINGGEWVKYSEDNPRLFPRKNVAFKLENRDGKYVVIFDYVNPFTDEYDPVEITRVAGFVVLRMSSNDRAMANKTNPISGPLKTFEEIVAELRVQAEPFLNDEYVKNNYKFWDAKAYADLKGRVIKTVERRNSNISVKWVYKNDLYRPSLESVYADYDGLPEQKERFQDLAVKETYFKQILINGKFILSADEKDKERTNYMLYLAVELGLISVPTDDAMTTPQTNYVETTDEIKEVLKNWQTAVRVFNTNNYLDRHKDVPDGDIVLFYAGDKNNPQGILLATWISDKQRWNIDIVEANKGDRSNVGRLLVEGFVNEYGQDLIGIQPIRMDGGKVEVWIRVLRSLGFRGSGFDFMHYPDKAMNAASSRGVEQREFSRSNLQGLRTSVNRLDDRVFRLSLEIEYLEKLRNSYRRAFLLLTQVEDPKDRSYEFEKLVEGPAVVLEAGGEYHLARKGPLHMGDETKKLMKAVSRRAKRENAYTNEAWQKAINEVSASLNADLQHAIDGKKVVKESIGGRLEVERGLLDKINGARRSINNKDNVREIKYMEEFLSNLNVMFQRLAPMYKDKKDAKVFYLTDIFTLSSFRIKNINTKIFGNYLVNLANEMSKNEAMHEIMLAFKDFLATQQTTLSIDKGLLLNIEEAKELKSLFVGFILQRLTSAVEGYEKILASFNNGHRQYVLESIDYDIDLLKRNVTILLEDKYIEEGQRNQLKTLLSRLDALTWNAPTLRGMDLAMNTTDQYGGIDLKATADNTLVKKDLENGVQMDIDPAMIERFKRDGIESLTPVIFNITPIANIWQTIGLTPP